MMKISNFRLEHGTISNEDGLFLFNIFSLSKLYKSIQQISYSKYLTKQYNNRRILKSAFMEDK